MPAEPACVANYGGPSFNGTWEPGTCYGSVDQPAVVGCAYIDRLDGDAFKEGPCLDALYKSPYGVPNALFSFAPANATPPGTDAGATISSCENRGDFGTYIYGGNALVEAAKWGNKGPLTLDCKVTFNGPRPDGLYGPTWVKMRAGIGLGVGSGRLLSKTSEFYVPIDGDLRSSDLIVTGEATISELDWDEGRLFITYRAQLTSGDDATNVKFALALPSVAIAERVTRQNCPDPNPQPTPTSGNKKVGGSTQCAWSSMGKGEVASLEVVARIVDATDLDAIQKGLELQNFRDAVNFQGKQVRLRGALAFASADEDTDPDNSLAQLRVDIPFRGYRYSDTRASMKALATYFNYQHTVPKGTALQCDAFANDIWTRLEQIRADHPDALADLSFGRITSGTYTVPIVGGDAGHVGVVVYRKGSNYRESGIIVHGLPSPNPRMRLVSQVGDTAGNNVLIGPLYWTWLSPGWYFRTEALDFQNVTSTVPHKEGAGADGFEGRYLDNATEFSWNGAAAPEQARNPNTWPVTPEAVQVSTESPVEIVLTNPAGQRVVTENGMIVTQELDTTIYATATRHDDGTYAWTILLPADEYKVKLKGVGDGPYTFTRTTFSADNEAIDEVVTGTTAPGQVDKFTLSAPQASAFPPPSSGGGSLALGDLPWLLGAVAALGLGARRQRQRKRSDSAH